MSGILLIKTKKKDCSMNLMIIISEIIEAK